MTASCFALLNKYCMECYAAMMDNREIFTRSEVRCNKKLQVFGIIFGIRQTESEKNNEEAVCKAWKNGSQTISRGWRTSEEVFT